MKKLLLLSFVLFSFSSFAQVLLQDDFNYPAGDLLTAHGYTAHSGAGTNSIKSVAPGLSYAGYTNDATTGIGMVATGEDVNIKIAGDSVAAGSVYAAFLINITSATTTGDYIFLLSNKLMSTSSYIGRLFIKKDATGNIAFGVSKSSASVTYPATYSTFTYAVATTYLLVVKYAFSSVGTMDDTVSVFVNPSLAGTEPAATFSHTDIAALDLPSFGAIAFRQGGSASGPVLTIDGLRIAKTWGEALGLATAVGNETAKAKTFGLDQNYPNPFNPSTMISFNLASNEFATLKVYDVLGNEVSTLVNGSMTAGQHQVSFDASKLTSGVYVYRLTAGNMVDTKKMTIMK